MVVHLGYQAVAGTDCQVRMDAFDFELSPLQLKVLCTRLKSQEDPIITYSLLS